MPFAFLLAIEEHDSLKFDAVVVDEGQDLPGNVDVPRSFAER